MEKNLVDWIEKQLRIRNWRPAVLAQKAQISDGALSRILSGTRQAGPRACVAIAKAFSVDPVFVFRLCGLLPPLDSQDEIDPIFQELWSLYSELSPDERRWAVRFLRGLTLTPDVSLNKHTRQEGEMTEETRHIELDRELAIGLFSTIVEQATPEQRNNMSKLLQEMQDK